MEDGDPSALAEPPIPFRRVDRDRLDGVGGLNRAALINVSLPGAVNVQDSRTAKGAEPQIARRRIDGDGSCGANR